MASSVFSDLTSLSLAWLTSNDWRCGLRCGRLSYIVSLYIYTFIGTLSLSFVFSSVLAFYPWISFPPVALRSHVISSSLC